MMLSRITCAVALSLGLATSVPTVSLAETTPDAEQLEFDGLQRLLGGETITAIAPLETAFALYQAANDEAGIRRIADMLWVAYGAFGLEP